MAAAGQDLDEHGQTIAEVLWRLERSERLGCVSRVSMRGMETTGKMRDT